MPQDAIQNEKKVLAAVILRREGRLVQTPAIDFHSSVGEGTLADEAAESLKANRIDPKLLYVTPRQTELWRQVFLRHSPIHANPEFARIYRDAFAQTAKQLGPGKVAIIGLGCGTGLKELELFSSLKARGIHASFSAIDVSHDLVVESVQKLVEAGTAHQRSLVCDLANSIFISDWLNQFDQGLPRVITFFGLVPNLAPSVVIRLFSAVLRPGDILLASAHLAPVGNGIELSDAMKRVLPQYNNPETLAWLSAALEQWNLQDAVDLPEMKIDQIESVPAFIATAKWKSGKKEPLQLFHSLRYVPSLFEEIFSSAGFAMERLSMTACREEAIWAVRKRA
jgi:hypothetical protein